MVADACGEVSLLLGELTRLIPMVYKAMAISPRTVAKAWLRVQLAGREVV
jgi:hypothetical protein